MHFQSHNLPEVRKRNTWTFPYEIRQPTSQQTLRPKVIFRKTNITYGKNKKHQEKYSAYMYKSCSLKIRLVAHSLIGSHTLNSQYLISYRTNKNKIKLEPLSPTYHNNPFQLAVPNIKIYAR